jgi:hypothetical protein
MGRLLFFLVLAALLAAAAGYVVWGNSIAWGT